MTSSIDATAVEIARLRLEPGDVLVIRLKSQASEVVVANLLRAVRSYVPKDFPVMLVNADDVELAVVSRSDER